MRISLLEKRENFDKILLETLISSSFDKTNGVESVQKYLLNKYMNFIASPTLNKREFWVLINEYSNSVNLFKNGFQWLYVRLAVSHIFRQLFSQRTVLLPSRFEEYLILGGNHRIRLFSKKINGTIVLLKSNERLEYISNDVAIRSENNLEYAPKILRYSDDWIEEEYFDGTPLNRIKDKAMRQSIVTRASIEHWKSLIAKSVREISTDNYFEDVSKEIESILSISLLEADYEIKDMIRSTLQNLFKKVNTKIVKVSWSHGDFQQANILVSGGYYKVIDWEAANKRYYLYDFFVLWGENRSNNNLEQVICSFYKKSRKIDFTGGIVQQDIFFILIEELKFRVIESCSMNYLQLIEIQKICESIRLYLND